MSEIITLDQFEADQKEGLHNTDYILQKLAEIATEYSVFESMKGGEYTLQIIDESNGEELFQATTDAKERINLIYIYLEYFLRDRADDDEKPSLKLVN